jgi:flagellar biosynthetic protein FlhB
VQQNEHDRTEQATPFKLEESRNRGDVLRSGDFNSFALISALLVLLLGFGAAAWMKLAVSSQEMFGYASAPDYLLLLELAGRQLMAVVLPFGLAAIVAVILSNLVQTGPVFSFAPLKARFERINPISGFRRIFSKRMLFELGKSLLKLGLLGAVAFYYLRGAWPDLILTGEKSTAAQAEFFASLGSGLLFRLAAVLLLIGLLDWIFVRWQYRRQMMMSRRDLKEEVKRREGDPQIRARLRELQRENLKQSRSLSRIPDADVLITNPDHFGVALRYVRAEMAAPIVIAKGSGTWVAQMKELAQRHSVTIRQRPPLARHLFRHGQIDRPIPADTYLEVARLYADLAAEIRGRPARYEVSS